MNSERLLKLADFLENDPRVQGHFNMAIVYDDSFREYLKGNHQEVPCGSVACALGWGHVCFDVQPCGVVDYDTTYAQERYLFYETSYGEAKWDGDLNFKPESIPPSVVADRIREFVASGGKVPEHV